MKDYVRFTTYLVMNDPPTLWRTIEYKARVRENMHLLEQNR